MKQAIRSLGWRLIAWVRQTREDFETASPSFQLALREEISRLRETSRARTPDSPALDGYKVYSQTDEDGIIQSILGRIGVDPADGSFLEIGSSDGLENNSHFLALMGFSGTWVEASSQKIKKIQDQLAPEDLSKGSRLRVENAFVEPDNVCDIVGRACDFLGTREIDFFSLDIDGNDFHVLESAMTCFDPKIVCIEYNAKFPPPTRLVMTYQRGYDWKSDDYSGASLQSFVDLLAGYTLVCCSVSGANGFFVRNDLAGSFTSYPVSDLYQPARYELIHLKSGHKPSLQWLQDILRAKSKG